MRCNELLSDKYCYCLSLHVTRLMAVSCLAAQFKFSFLSPYYLLCCFSAIGQSSSCDSYSMSGAWPQSYIKRFCLQHLEEVGRTSPHDLHILTMSSHRVLCASVKQACDLTRFLNDLTIFKKATSNQYRFYGGYNR